MVRKSPSEGIAEKCALCLMFNDQSQNAHCSENTFVLVVLSVPRAGRWTGGRSSIRYHVRASVFTVEKSSPVLRGGRGRDACFIFWITVPQIRAIAHFEVWLPGQYDASPYPKTAFQVRRDEAVALFTMILLLKNEIDER